METKVDELFSTLGVQFDVFETPSEIAEVKCHGIIRYLPEFMQKMGAKKGQYVWTSQSSWMEFRKNELEAWLVDVPIGEHIIIIGSQKDMEINYQCPEGVMLDLWDKEKLALLIGYSVLESNSDEQTPLSEEIENTPEVAVEKIERTFQVIKNKSNLCLKSHINPNDSLELLGISQVPCQPILLELSFWLIKGNLIGPENSIEEREWIVLEDNFSGEITLQDDLSFISSIPNLPILQISSKNSREKIQNNLNKLCDERRHESISTSELNSGKLLRWWKLDNKSIESMPKKVLLPSWLFISPIEGKKIINGLNGNVIDYKGELKGIP
ncbi:MAG: hypothetical protein CMA03_04020 [Euryarchaeota archaeon]|nr:hypothetical protein [Euryarchaeota archaeon]|tara:strand:+ start:665 stop:1642 length:978 start_codon:yes stop_codon:yes gene_type:complete